MEIKELCELIVNKQILFSKVKGTLEEIVKELQGASGLGPALAKLERHGNDFSVVLGQTILFKVTEERIMSHIKAHHKDINNINDTWLTNTVLEIIVGEVK